ncbi:MAG: hypothetical protein KatS3mg097_576 [Candidatus Parcubacteria bacterium]|nr:MAG: hypothetical protein KatS3mg097_576 [Candidatus Parcubacteria bacterium]
MSLKNYILQKNKDYYFKIATIEKINEQFIKLINKNKASVDFNKFRLLLKGIKPSNIANFIFILRVLDFQLWRFKKNWNYENQKEFYGLLLRTKKLFLTKNLIKIKFSDFKKIISPHENEYLAKKRFKLFRESLSWLNKNYQGNFDNYFEENNETFKFCQKLIQLKKFRDFHQNMYFLKPNQLLYLELIIAKNLLKNYKNNLEELTIFADYKLPQVLLNFHIIKIPQKYLQIINNQKIIKANSLLEKELRWASIIIGEKLNKILNMPSYIVDNILWQLSHKINLKIPHLRVKTIFY